MARYTTSGTVNTVSQINAELEKIQASIAELFSRNGESPNAVNSVLDMNNNSILNLPFPAGPNSPLRLGDVSSAATTEVLVPPTYFNIKDYGALEGLSDNKTAIDAAISALESAGGGVLWIPRGKYKTSGLHTLTSNMSVQGEGYSSCLRAIYNAGDNSSNSIFEFISTTRPNIELRNVSFKNVRIEGCWEDAYKEVTMNSDIVIVGIDTFVMEHCWIENSGFGSFVINQGRNAHIRNCWFKNSARDMCRLWNCENSSVIGNTFLRNDDDCISINMAGFETVDGRPRQGIIIQGNYLRDTGGIRIQSAKNCVIDGNVLKLTKGAAGIALEGITTAGTRESNIHSCIVSNNTIADTIERILARNQDNSLSSNLRNGIKVSSGGGWTKSSFDITEPYDYFNTDTGAAGTDPLRVNELLHITGNLVIRTLPTATLYSDYGYGKMFTRFEDTTEDSEAYIVDGEADPEVLDQHLQCRSLEIRDGLHNSLIASNYFGGSGLQGIQFRAEDKVAADFDLRNVTVKDNVIRDFGNYGIDISTSYTGTHQDINIESNTIDGDPFFKDIARATSGPDFTGGWNDSTSVVGIFASSVESLKLMYNTFKNCSTAYTFGGVKSTNFIIDNRFIGQPDPTLSPRTFNSAHKGIGVYPADAMSEFKLIYTDSDPTSATYDQLLEQQVNNVDSTAPATGYYFDGQIVFARGGVPSAGNVTFAYRRLTDGTGHVLGTDWEELGANV